jgi:hypothetical protein
VRRRSRFTYLALHFSSRTRCWKVTSHLGDMLLSRMQMEGVGNLRCFRPCWLFTNGVHSSFGYDNRVKMVICDLSKPVNQRVEVNAPTEHRLFLMLFITNGGGL